MEAAAAAEADTQGHDPEVRAGVAAEHIMLLRVMVLTNWAVAVAVLMLLEIALDKPLEMVVLEPLF